MPPPGGLCQRELTKYEPKPRKALQRYNKIVRMSNLPDSFNDIFLNITRLAFHTLPILVWNEQADKALRNRRWL